MSGRPSRETVMQTLFAKLTSALQFAFTANTQAGSAVLASASSTAGLFIGLPVVGGSVPRGALIQSLSPLTLSLPASLNAHAVSFSTGFLTASRRLKFWGDVSAQPALFLRDTEEQLEYPGDIIFQRQTIRAEVWIYSRGGDDPDVTPATLLNNLLDAVQSAFAPDDPMQQRFTLGGLVDWCRMVGRVQKDTGDADGQAIALADVEIIVP